ncbi:hypothetical protein [Lysobacter gummosus]
MRAVPSSARCSIRRPRLSNTKVSFKRYSIHCEPAATTRSPLLSVDT